MFQAARHQRDALEQRRLLHARIARSRRRLSGQTTGLLCGRLLPTTWRRQIQDHPLWALAAAAGAGMLLAQLGSRSKTAGRSADWLAEQLAGVTGTSLMQQLERFLAADKAGSTPPVTEPADG